MRPFIQQICVLLFSRYASFYTADMRPFIQQICILLYSRIVWWIFLFLIPYVDKYCQLSAWETFLRVLKVFINCVRCSRLAWEVMWKLVRKGLLTLLMPILGFYFGGLELKSKELWIRQGHPKERIKKEKYKCSEWVQKFSNRD